MTEPKFVVGQRVKRIENKEIVGAVVLDVVVLDNKIHHVHHGCKYSYQIQYDEGPCGNNDGTGWWSENYLEPE
jgi:hypothetical protein